MQDFYEKYDHLIMPEPMSGCFIWLGSTTSGGYGNLTRYNKSFYAHRCAYEATHGDGAADGLLVRHWCDNPPCVSPVHLLLGSHLNNHWDCVQRGRARYSSGAKVPTAKLDESKVLAIRTRAAAGEQVADLAREFGVKWDTINYVVHGVFWRHVGGPTR